MTTFILSLFFRVFCSGKINKSKKIKPPKDEIQPLLILLLLAEPYV